MTRRTGHRGPDPDETLDTVLDMVQLDPSLAPRAPGARPDRPAPVAPRWLGPGLVVLAVALAVNTLLGPLVGDVIDYPFSETVRNEALGLEAVSLVLVAPMCVVAGLLVLRDRAEGAVLALGPTAYTVYMFVQYVVGPGYPTYARSIVAHTAIFTLAGALLVGSWHASAPTLRWALSPRSARRWSWVTFGLAVFVVSRWIDAFGSMADQGPLVEAYQADAGMYWSIFLLDLGIVVPALVATGVGLRRDRGWATTSLFALVGWFVLVPPSVTAMSVVKLVRDDPHGDLADAIVLGVAAVVFAAIAVVLYRRIFLSGSFDRADEDVRRGRARRAGHS